MTTAQFKTNCKQMFLAEVRERGPISPREAGRFVGISALTALAWLRDLCNEGQLVEWEVRVSYSLFGEAPR